MKMPVCLQVGTQRIGWEDLFTRPPIAVSCTCAGTSYEVPKRTCNIFPKSCRDGS